MTVVLGSSRIQNYLQHQRWSVRPAEPVISKLQSAALLPLKGPMRTADSHLALTHNVQFHRSGNMPGKIKIYPKPFFNK